MLARLSVSYPGKFRHRANLLRTALRTLRARTSSANLNILDGLNHVFSSSPLLARVSEYPRFESIQNNPKSCHLSGVGV